MNAERLLQFIDDLLAQEAKLALQRKFNELQSSMNNLASQPQQPQFQTEVAQRLDDLEKQLQTLVGEMSAAQLGLIKDIGADAYFTLEATNKIKDAMQKNAMTPAIVQQGLQATASLRQEYINTLQKIRDGLIAIKIEPHELDEGGAEIGFLIPRDLFDNTLDGLSQELKVINRIIGFFSEAATGKQEPVEVHQISSSDPTFFFGLAVATIIAIGKTTTWLLDTWKKVLEVRDLHQKAQKAGLSEKALQPFEEHVKASIDQAIETRITELLGVKEVKVGRDGELENGLRWSMHSLMARIERGMTIEIRFIPPPASTKDEVTSSDSDNQAFETLEVVAKDLAFPTSHGRPILSLPGPEPEAKPKGASGKKT